MQRNMLLFPYPFSFASVPFGSVRLHRNRTERLRIGPFLQRGQKSMDSGSKWNSSNGSSVNAPTFASILNRFRLKLFHLLPG